MNFLKIAICVKLCAALPSTIMWKMNKSLVILDKSPKNTIFQHLIPYNPGLRIFSEKTPWEFCDLMEYNFMQKIKEILKAVLETNWSLTNY